MDDDEDEELLLLRIKALKSTPRVNISVEFTSDSDNDLSIIKTKTLCEKKLQSIDDGKKVQSSCPPCIDDEDEEERKLREIALSSLRRPAKRRSSNKVIVERKQENQSTTIHISHDVTSVDTVSGSHHKVLITSSSVSSEPKLQVCLQDDSTLQKHEDVINKVQKVQGTNDGRSNNEAGGKKVSGLPKSWTSIELTNCKLMPPGYIGPYPLLCAPQRKPEETSSAIQHEAIQHDLISSTSGDINGTHPTPDHRTLENVDDCIVSEKFTVSQSQLLANEQSCLPCKGTTDKLLQSNIITVEKVDSKDSIAPSNKLDKKLDREDLFKSDAIHTEDIASTENKQKTIKCTQDDVMEKMYPPLVEGFVPPEFGNYSPSSPSETDVEINNEPGAEVGSVGHNDTRDDVLSLCTSDKDEHELTGMFPGIELQEDTQVTCSNEIVHSESATMAQLENSPDAPSGKSDSEKEIDTSCLDEDPMNSNASGLNIILDRYLSEVAAKKKIKAILEDEDEHCNSPDDLGIVDSSKESRTNPIVSHALGDCVPGPSGYKKPTIIHGYDSESEESLVETKPFDTKGVSEKELVAAVKSKVTGEEDSSNSADIKGALQEKNVQDAVQDATCSVCLGPFENRAFLNLCFHSFCYMCIFQWSELSRLCPLCKTKYTSLIHSVNTDLDYEMYEFPDDIPILDRDDGIPHRREFSETMDDGRRFRYRSTVVDHEEWARRKIERERIEQEYMRSRQQRRMKRRLKWTAARDTRRSVYQKDIHVKEVKQRGTPKFRDISPEFFAENPALKHRLVPWLLRDLNVLLGNEDENIRFVMTLILNLISKLSLREDPFKEQLRPFLFEQTDHFVEELVSFASSPYDIRGYDNNVRYNKPENDVEFISMSKPAIQISDDSTDEKKENVLLQEVFLEDQEGGSPLGDNSIEDILPEASDRNNASPMHPLLRGLSVYDDETDVEVTVDAVSPPVADKNGGAGNNDHDDNNDNDDDDDRDEKNKSGEEHSSSDESLSGGSKKRRKDVKKEKRKKRKRKRKRSDIEKSRPKKKSAKKEGVKKKRKTVALNGVSDDDASSAFLRKDAKDLICDEKDISTGNKPESRIENKKSDVSSARPNLDKKVISEKETDHKKRRRREEQRKRRKHRKKYKHIKYTKNTKRHLKHLKRKRRRIRSSSSEDDDDIDSKVPHKSKKNTESGSSKKTDTAEPDFPLKKTIVRKKDAALLKEDKSSKKALKRKRTSSGSEHVPKRKRGENDNNVKVRRKKKERKKKKKKKHRKDSLTKKRTQAPVEAKTNMGNGVVDTDLRSKIGHAINAIMVTKGGTNSSDDEDEFLNSQEVQDLLSKYKYNDKLELIKDGDGYKTRAEVVHELLLIEKAISRRKEKKQKQKNQTDASKSISVNGEPAKLHPEGLGGKTSSESLTDKAFKKAEREKSYKVLIQELQEIEGRINSCRSSLQAKPTGMI